MSESIWYEEVDTALVDLLQETIHIDGKPVKVLVLKPDDDFDDEDYPLITIYNLFDRFSVERYNPEPVVVSQSVSKRTAILEDSALPYDLFYQIDFWATLQSDMNEMTKQWKAYASRWFNLSVIDKLGTSRSCFVLSRNDFGKSDLVKKGKRLFHCFGTYKIQVELDENVQTVAPMVVSTTDVSVGTK